MTTTIRGTDGVPEFTLTGVPGHVSGEGVHLGCVDHGTGMSHLSRTAFVPTAEFLAAVAAEIGVITIPRTDLPAVFKDDTHYLVGSTSWPHKVAHDLGQRFRVDALESLAMAEHLDANPPIDEAEVDALATLLKDDAQFGLGRPDADEIARRLVKAGVRAPKETS